VKVGWGWSTGPTTPGEALTLSKLNHPAIATAFDFNTREGVDFLVMELVTGETLKQKLSKGPLPEKEVLRLGLQLAEGLAAAHEHDILHRDLKPGNLRITADGRLKILDFGLAKLVRPAGDIGTTATVTQTRGVVGTVPYMSPEQLRGEAIDGRSDIYAAGAVLYELSTGQRPFPETQGPLLINGILNQAPEAPSGVNPQVSAELESIILKALDKDPERRYQSARELQVDLGRLGDSAVTIAPVRRARAGRWRLPLVSAVVVLIAVAAALYLSTGRTEAMNTLAVMPFVNVSSDAEAEYLCDGITESLINRLAELPSVSKVIARGSVFVYKGQDVDPREVGRELGVKALITGRVVHQGDELSISVEGPGQSSRLG
jgi:non-specific serine/threonine protein kinase